MKIGDSLQMMSGKQHRGSPLVKGNQDFMILCPVVAENSGVLEALYALYYLPQNYKLVISSVGIKSKVLYERIREIMRTDTLKNRIIMQDAAGIPEMASPYLDASVVLYGSSDPVYTKDAPQAIVVFDIASKIMRFNGQHNFAVAASNPESVASAILKVARKQHG